jgi:hypothetical protein
VRGKEEKGKIGRDQRKNEREVVETGSGWQVVSTGDTKKRRGQGK